MQRADMRRLFTVARSFWVNGGNDSKSTARRELTAEDAMGKKKRI
jgi:hypothetical protein